jgi:hypothetical protein
MDKYVSFCAEAKGLLFQTLFETVNSEFQECATMEEPIVIKKFDGSNLQITTSILKTDFSID